MALAVVDARARARRLEPVGALGQHEVVGERVDVVEADVVAVRRRRRSSGLARVDDRCGDELEVRGAVGVGDDRRTGRRARASSGARRSTRGRSRAARPPCGSRRRRRRSGRTTPRRRLRRRRDQDEAAAARAVRPTTKKRSSSSWNTSTSSASVGAERVAPHLPRAHRVVGPDVEARARVVGPREAVVTSSTTSARSTPVVEVAEAQRVALAAGRVDGVRERCGGRADGEAAEREVVVPVGERVLVEQDLLVAVGARAARPPAVDRVLLALDRAREVLPRAVRTGADTSVSWTRPLISSKICSCSGSVGASTASVYAFSASRYASTSGSSRSRSQYQSSTRSSPCSESDGRAARGASRRRRCRPSAGSLETPESRRTSTATMRRTMSPTIDADPVHRRAELDAVAYDADGLVAAIVQEAGTGQVLMFAWMNHEALGARSRPAAPGSGAAAARSTGARARRRATGSTCARPTTTATWTSLLVRRRAGGPGRVPHRASAAASSARSAAARRPVPS